MIVEINGSPATIWGLLTIMDPALAFLLGGLLGLAMLCLWELRR